MTMKPSDLNDDERDLLKWLGEIDLSQYGECHGNSLDSLIEKGLAQVHGIETERDNPFIAKGDGIMFRAVSLTEAGQQLRREVLSLEASLKRHPSTGRYQQ